MNLLCRIGRHKWQYLKKKPNADRVCIREDCEKHQIQRWDPITLPIFDNWQWEEVTKTDRSDRSKRRMREICFGNSLCNDCAKKHGPCAQDLVHSCTGFTLVTKQRGNNE